MKYRGNRSLVDKKKVAIVGPRISASKTNVEVLASYLSKKGYAIVNGMNEGIETIALMGAMPNSIAVMPTPIGQCYPTGSKEFMKRMEKEALVLSDYETFDKKNFSDRDRRIAEISDAIIFVDMDNSHTFDIVRTAVKNGKPILCPNAFVMKFENWSMIDNLSNICELNVFRNTKELMSILESPENIMSYVDEKGRKIERRK